MEAMLRNTERATIRLTPMMPHPVRYTYQSLATGWIVRSFCATE